MMGTINKIIQRSPGPIRRAIQAIVPFRYRWNAEYRQTLGMLGITELWKRNHIEAFQRIMLRHLIEHAYKNVPYYHQAMVYRGLRPSDIQKPEDLSKLPLLTKDIVRERGDELRARSFTGRTATFSTSGSTGEPFKFIGDESLFRAEAAFITRTYSAHATRLYDEKIVWMRRYAPPEGAPIYRYDPELGRHYLSAFHLSAQTIKDYVQIIDDTKARCLSTYPSSAYILAMLLKQADLRLKHVQVIHAASEQLLPEWVPTIEKTIGPIYDHYGLIEKVSLFHRCPQSAGLYHENLEYGVTEIVDGQVIGTSLWNHAMPFIRYQTGDLAEPNDGDQQCACGSGLPLTVKAFTGRSDDILVTPDGRYIPAVNFYTMMYKTQGIGMFQLVQESPGHVTALIVPGPGFVLGWDGTLTQVMEGLKIRLGKEIGLAVKAVANIERDESTGKIRCVRRLFPLGQHLQKG